MLCCRTWRQERLSLTEDMSIELEIGGEEEMNPGPSNESKINNVGKFGEHDNLKDLNLLSTAYDLLTQGNPSGYQKLLATAQKERPELSVHELKSPLDSTLLHIAASHGNNEVVCRMLLENPKYFDAINMNHDTPLHVAARAGHVSTVHKLLAVYVDSLLNGSVQLRQENIAMETLEFTIKKNKQGNTTFHEALMRSRFDGEKFFELVFKEPIIKHNKEENDLFVDHVHGAALDVANQEGKSALYLATELGSKELVNQILKHSKDALPAGKSPFLAAFTKQDPGILGIMQETKPEWKHLMDDEERNPLHYAASIGYHYGVKCLLEKCASCSIERDVYGFFPIHLASDRGHLEVVKELLKYCPDPFEMLDSNLRQNILHIAAQSGKLNVVTYILQDPKLEKMINQRDKNGNTPLHLAALRCHPKVVHVLTRNKKVDLTLKNLMNQTALDAANQNAQENPFLRQRLTRSALKSAGAKTAADLPGNTIGIPLQSTERIVKAPNMENYKDRIDTLIVVSTLIITVTFAAGFTMPGGNNDSDPGKGMANMLKHAVFHLFIVSITISMYGAIGVTIILIWSRLGDLHLAFLALKFGMPLLGITLLTLSLAFLAGVYLVISQLHVLATAFLVMASIFILMLALLYVLLWFPSSSSFSILRCISYDPFKFLASLAEGEIFVH